MKLAGFVNWIGIMSYDLTGSWNASPVGKTLSLLYLLNNNYALINDLIGPHSALERIERKDMKKYAAEQQAGIKYNGYI